MAGLGLEQGKRLITNADTESFESISFDCNCSFEFARDRSHLYIDGEPIKNIDAQTFDFIGNYVFRDKNSAYFLGFYNDINDCVIKGVNPSKLELIEYPWAKVGNTLIHGKDTVRLNNTNDFTPIDEDWGKTNEYIINKDRILYSADIETFKIINSFSGKDKNYNYKLGFIDDDTFNKINYKSFDFETENLCIIEPTEFIDIYSKLEPFIEEQSEHILIAERLKEKGFKIKKTRHTNSGESKIISIEMANNICNCYIDKYYQYDYSKPSEIDSIFKITERIHCQTKK
ncbi:DKNYY domain-containing protein [bacterium]|nr:DKNYY domain-containing protein [bacterium]